MTEATTKGKVTTTVAGLVRHILRNYEGAELEAALIEVWSDTLAAERTAAHAAGRAEGRAEALDYAAGAFDATGETFSAARLRQMKP